MQVRPLKRIQPFALLPSPKLAMRHIWLDVTTLVGIAKKVSIVGKRDLVSASSPSQAGACQARRSSIMHVLTLCWCFWRSTAGTQIIGDRALTAAMTTDELVRTILPNLDRSWVGVKRFDAGAAVRTPVLRGIQTDTVAGTLLSIAHPQTQRSEDPEPGNGIAPDGGRAERRSTVNATATCIFEVVDAAGEPVRSPRSSHKAAVAKRQLRADRAAGREAWADEKRRNGLAQPEDEDEDKDENENDDEDDEDEDENDEDENDAMDEDEDKDENDAMDEDENEDEVVKKLDKVRAQRGSLGP